MSDGYRNGAFALGLIAGIGLTLNVVVWLDYKANSDGNQPPHAYGDDSRSEVGKIWDWLIGTFVSPSDTLAQWIMAVFTIAAVLLVWRTLKATQEMVSDTREIGNHQMKFAESSILSAKEANSIAVQSIREQNRPFLFIEVSPKNVLAWRDEGEDLDWSFCFFNHGTGPAVLNFATGKGQVSGGMPDSNDLGMGSGVRLTGSATIDKVEQIVIAPGAASPVYHAICHRLTNKPVAGLATVSEYYAGKVFAWFDVLARYSDAYGNEHETRGLYRMQFSGFKISEYGGKERNYRT